MPVSARIQPQGRVRINRGNALTRGLQFAYVPGGGSTDATGKRTRLSEPPPATSPFGKITPPLNGGTFPIYGYCDSPNTGGFTAIVLGIFDPLPGAGTADQREPLLALGNWKFTNRQGNAGYTAYSVADYDVTCPLPASGMVGISATFGTSARFFVGGAFKTSVAISAPNAATNAQFGVGTRAVGGDVTGKSQIALALYWDRILSDAEHAAIAANPWQLFDAPAPMLYAASAPTTVSGGITWTEASDSVAAAGAATVTSAAAWTEAADSAALAGSIGSAVGINAAWTEAADSVAIAGSAQVNAAAAWTEAADSISMAGSAGNSVAANISWTEAADVTTAAGTIRINAAGSWTEAGDTAAIVVNVAGANSAQISWTEAPDGIASAGSLRVNASIGWVEAADLGAPPSYPKFYAYTLMRADPVSAAGYISGSATQFTLMRSNPLYAASAMTDAPLNRTVNLI